ncbi:class I mannose-6-phosphate isomerase [Erythrobacter sp. Alg231-14]|uniref:class I mannose-6-phosphate isomerase n=1 Tax=Erythrobacter sp. Alg231-14 TaxID=1922225 RepID=UPI003FCE92D1
MRVRKIQTRMVEKVWGRTKLPAPFSATDGARIGEIWFEPPPELPQLLVKYLFTSEKLSVQVHPSNADALPGEDGKEECWLVLDAEPGAQLAIGFDEEISADRMAKAAQDGSIESLLTWHDARPGDVYFLPAGTVHAIGPGLSLVEVQQNSDTTFRLYDYGRPRDLHLDRALAVAQRRPYDPHHKSTATCGASRCDGPLVSSTHFQLDRVEGSPDAGITDRYPNGLLVLPLEGEVRAVEEDQVSAKAGECLFAADIGALDFSDAKVTLLTRPA